MVSKFTAKVVSFGNSLSITLPKPLCDGFGIKKGDEVTIYDRGDLMEIPMEGISHSTRTLGWTLKVKGTKPATASSNAQPDKPESPKGKDDPS